MVSSVVTPKTIIERWHKSKRSEKVGAFLRIGRAFPGIVDGGLSSSSPNSNIGTQSIVNLCGILQVIAMMKIRTYAGERQKRREIYKSKNEGYNANVRNSERKTCESLMVFNIRVPDRESPHISLQQNVVGCVNHHKTVHGVPYRAVFQKSFSVGSFFGQMEMGRVMAHASSCKRTSLILTYKKIFWLLKNKYRKT